MKIGLFAYSKNGLNLGEKILALFSGDEIKAYSVKRLANDTYAPIPPESSKLYREIFAWADCMIFVSSCGIAVRCISDYIKDKTKDPAVIVIDELGRFTIPILSGHIGGANDLAKKIAQNINSIPVITTATDINGKFAVDSWATVNNCAISSMKYAKEVSSLILEEDVPLMSDFHIASNLPNGLKHSREGEVGIYITYKKSSPFKKTLRLIPKILYVGIGCRRGTSAVDISDAVDRVFTDNGLDKLAINRFSSIDLKKDEEGLLDYCKNNGYDIDFYSSKTLNSVEGDFSGSDFVREITGVDNVCERSAAIYADKLIVRKTAYNKVTIAIGVKNWEVNFG